MKNFVGNLSAYLFLVIIFPFLHSASAVGFLHSQGEDIVDEQGQKILLRSVGLGNWLLPEGYMWRFGKEGDRPRKIEKIVSDLIGPESAAKFWKNYRAQYITQRDIQRIAQLGFNSVRPAMNARLILSEGDNPLYQDEGFELLDNLIDWCKQSGIYVILDMHAAPGGQTGQNIDDSINDEPRLFMNPTNQDRLVALWVKIATRYKNEPTVAAYDLLNEPLPERTGAARKYKSELEPLYQRITKAIRAVDKKHMITVEGVDWANDWSVFSAPFDDNLVYQFHYYCWNKPTHLDDIDRYLAARQRLGAPVWAGETGEKDNTIYWATTDYFEANNIGWSFWPWKKMEAKNAPYSIKTPQNWDTIMAYSRTAGTNKPPREAAQKVFDEFLHNVRLENCVFFSDVINAIFRRVPGKVEAENYGHDGFNHSYFVNDKKLKPDLYRTREPVPVVPAENSGQAVRLNSGEWTAYAINSQRSQTYALTIRARVESEMTTFQVEVNGASQEASASGQGWVEYKLKPASLVAGTNQIKLLVTEGSADFDWMEFH